MDNLSNSDLSNLQKLESYFKASIPFYNIDYENNQRVFFYVERNIERLLYEPSINQLHSFKLLKFNNSLDLDLDKAHKSFPENKPQFILIKHD